MNTQYADDLKSTLDFLASLEPQLAESDYNLSLYEAEAVLAVNEDKRYKNEASRKAAVVLFLNDHKGYQGEIKINRKLAESVRKCKADIEYRRALLRIQVAEIEGE